jgi:hypothetical protein
MGKYDEKVVTQLANHVIDNEYTVEKANSKPEYDDFEAAIELFENERVERDYDWMSDIPLPEFAAQMLTQTSIDVSQYFQTRDFVETYIQDPSDEALLAADAAEECLNRTLNRRDLYHYQKFVRAKTMNNIGGQVVAHCWWEKKNGRGKFSYEILDPRSVIMSREYTYSLQQKEWLQIEYDRTLPELIAEKKAMKYFDLDQLKDLNTDGETPVKHQTRDRDDQPTKHDPKRKWEGPFTIVRRFGKFWVDENGAPGLDENGNVKEGAELKEMVITFALCKGNKYLIGFHQQPYKDAAGNPFRPVLRGLCYIHPTRDQGLGDGHFARPLQKAINDTFNISNDRVRLATMPTMQGKKYTTEDSDDIYFEPQHIMSVNEVGDIEEFQISDNIEGAMTQLGILTSKMQQTTSVYPPTMGDTEQSETATAIVTGERHTNQRTNYKSLTFEYTFLNELYWIILQMTWQHATAKDALELMGTKVKDFNPLYDYYYKPLSQSIETDSSKNAKVKHWTTVLGYIANMQHPNAPNIFNYILSKIVVLMGDEYENISDKLLNPEQPMQPGETPESPGNQYEGPSNQYGAPIEEPEAATRVGTQGIQ